MSSVPLHYVNLRTFCFATEDEKRVIEALQTLLPSEFTIERAESTGHFGDRILVLSARVETTSDMQHLLDRLSTLPDPSVILTDLPDRVDENCSLFIRLDKQRAYRGEISLGEGIQLRAKIETYPANRDRAIETVRSIFG